MASGDAASAGEASGLKLPLLVCVVVIVGFAGVV